MSQERDRAKCPAQPRCRTRSFGALLLAAVGLMACSTHATADIPLPAARMQVTQPVPPAEAARMLGERRAPAAGAASLAADTVATASAAEAPDPRILELARALGHDPDRIYQYVHDRIAFEPTYGLQKGALGTLLDQRGNAFDQAALMVALLRASGMDARYLHGELRLDPQSVAELLGVAPNSDAIGYALGSGGIPAQQWLYADGVLAYVDFAQVWVEADIDGMVWSFDPALKRHVRGSGIDAAALAGYDPASLLTAAGVVSEGGSSAIDSFDRAGLRDALDTYTGTLVTALRASHAGRTVEDVLGDWTVVPTPNGPDNPLRQSAHPRLNLATASAASPASPVVPMWICLGTWRAA